MRVRPAALTLVLCASTGSLAVGAPAATSAPPRTYMSCGFGALTADGETFAKSSFTFHRHPRKCVYSADGTTASTVNLVKLRWSHWGSRKATAVGYQVDNHDMDRNGFQEHRRRLAVSGRVTRGGRAYYTKLTLGGRDRFTTKLALPGD